MILFISFLFNWFISSTDTCWKHAFCFLVAHFFEVKHIKQLIIFTGGLFSHWTKSGGPSVHGHMACHLPYGSRQCCLPPYTSEHTRLNPSQTGQYSIYLSLLQRDGRLSWPRWPVTYQDGLPAHRRSPIQVQPSSARPGVELVTCWSQVRRPSHYTTNPPRVMVAVEVHVVLCTFCFVELQVICINMHALPSAVCK